MTVQLSKRDKIMLAMAALSEIDDRLAQPDNQNQINFSGAMLVSENIGYLEEKYGEMSDWTEQQLLDFASGTLEGNLS
ncbi:MAG: hypothetical protein AAGG00_02375 [Cyanobacteria bacterium P01_H01_bin.150]